MIDKNTALNQDSVSESDKEIYEWEMQKMKTGISHLRNSK